MTASPNASWMGAVPHFASGAGLRLETVVTVTGRVVARAEAAVNPRLATGRRRGGRAGSGRGVGRRCVASTHQQRRRVSRGDAPALPVPRPPPPAGPSLHPAPEPGHRVHPAADDRLWLHRVSDPHLDLELAGGRPRLSRAEPRASGEVLRPAPGAPAVQATADGGGLRSVLPDRPVLPRRGRSGRPVTG